MPPCLHRVTTSRCGAGGPRVVVRGTGHHHWPCNTMPMSPPQSPLTMKVSDSVRRALPFPAGKRFAHCSFPGDAESSRETPDAERPGSAAAAAGAMNLGKPTRPPPSPAAPGGIPSRMVEPMRCPISTPDAQHNAKRDFTKLQESLLHPPRRLGLDRVSRSKPSDSNVGAVGEFLQLSITKTAPSRFRPSPAPSVD